MGVKARLKSGKANTGQDRYGYQRIDDQIVVVEEEARWVRKVFEWYLDGCHLMEIRDRLIAGGAPQKGSSIPRRIQWARSSIQAILKSAKEYAYGIKIQSRKGELFEIPVDPIINTATFERFVELRAWKKTYPASRLHRDYLLGGILHCACGNKWGARTQKTRKNRKGVLVERKTLTGIYYCRQNHKDLVSPDCPRHIGSKKADEEAWEKICGVVDRPEYLLTQARNLIEQLRANAANLHEERDREERDRIEKELERINADRQWVITSARQGKFTNNDMEQQLATLTLQKISYKRDLSALGQTININALDNWEAKFEEYLADLQAGVEALKGTAPQNEEERYKLFLLKKQVVDTLVQRVTISKDRKINVEIRLDLLKILDQDAGLENLSPAAYSRRGETYTRKRSVRARRRRCAFCG